jgi:hypothetical protein
MGTSDQSDVVPFSGLYWGEYQQLYSSSIFDGPVTIDGIAFASTDTAIPSLGPTVLNVTIGLSTTSKTVSTLTDSFAANEGADFRDVYLGMITYSPLDSGTFDLFFNMTPFTYDPANGNLLLDVMINQVIQSGGLTTFGFTSQPSVTARVFKLDFDGTPDNGVGISSGGLVTEFLTASPEPATISSCCLSLLTALVLYARRKARQLKVDGSTQRFSESV